MNHGECYERRSRRMVCKQNKGTEYIIIVFNSNNTNIF